MKDECVIRNTFDQSPEKGCELLFRQYYTSLCNHASRFVRSKEASEDIVSEVFAIFWQNKTFKHIHYSYRSYLYQSVRHRSYNYLKWDVARTVPLDDFPVQFKTSSYNPCEALQFTELHQQVERVVQALPAQCQRAFVLKRIEGKTLEEIAAELHITSKSVEALITRAIAKLRNKLEGHRLGS